MQKNIGEIITRRTTLARLASAGAAAWFIPAWNEAIEAQSTISCVAATPTVTEGPYWVDEKLFRSDIRTDPTTGAARAGVPLTLNMTFQNTSGSGCVPLVGAYIDIWHCDAKGIYSDESTYNPGGGTGNVTTTGQKFLRGYQITDANGQVSFTTIYPGWYSGRTIHIHIRVRTYSGTTVLGNFVTQMFFDDTVNNAVMAQTAYSRTNARDTSNSNDMVYQIANNTRMLATLVGDVTNGYTAALTAGVTLSVAAAALPSLSAGGVANAVGGQAGSSPGSWITVFGSNLSSQTLALTSSSLVNNTIPTSMGGVSVSINGKAASIGYVSPTQINALAPDDTATGAVALYVTNSVGISNSEAVTSQAVLPGLSTANSFVRAIRYPDGVIVNGTGAAETGYTSTAAIGQGDTVALYGTGFGPTTSSIATGVIFTGAYPTKNTVTVTVGGISAQVLWAGLVGAGLYQINIVVPAAAADGSQSVVAMVAGLSTQSGAMLKVAASSKLSARSRFGGNFAGRTWEDASRGALPVWARPHAGRQQLLALNGLTVLTDQVHSGGRMARLSLQAAERQGGVVQLA